MGNKALFIIALFGLLIIIPFSYAETFSCYIKNPIGTAAASDSVGVTECQPDTNTITVYCSATCPVTTAACCDTEGQYTWEVYDDPDFCCSSVCIDPPAASETGDAYYVNWSTQTYCLQTCIGSPAYWDSSLSQCCGVDFNDPDMSSDSCLNCPLGLNQGLREWNIGGIPNCCGDDSGEYIRDCEDNDEGFCIQASDNHACCDQLSDCVYNNNCYAWQEQTGEWKCGELELGIWHDIVAPWADIRINSGSPYTITRDVTLNLNISDNGTGVSECGFSNDDVNYIWGPCPGISKEGTDSVAYYDFDSIQDGQVLDWSGNDNHGSVYGNTRLLMHFDEGSGSTADDESSYGNDGTLQGGLDLTGWSSGCQSGSCLDFDGINDYIIAGNDASLNIRDEITIEAWIYPEGWGEALGVGFGRIIDKNKILLFLHNTASEYYDDHSLVFSIYISGAQRISTTQIDSISLNTWQHVAVTYDGSSLNMYINGVSQTLNQSYSGPPSGIIDSSIADSLYIGNRAGGGRAFDGPMDEVVIHSRALSEGEIIKNYNRGRAEFGELVPGRFVNALEFDGLDDYINVPDNGDVFDITTGEAMSVSVWINFSSDKTRNSILGKGSLLTDLFLGVDQVEAGKIEGCIDNICATSDNALNDNTWHHVVYVIDDVSDEQALWVDGIKQADTETVSPPPANSDPLVIGYGPTGQIPEYWNGTIDDVRIYDRALSLGEIEEIYSSDTTEEDRIKSWTLSLGDGVKTVYFQAKDKAGNSRKVSDTIILDTADPITWIDPPLPEWIGPEHGKWEGNENGSVKAFNVSWKAEDVSGIDRYQVQYNTSSISWTNWTVEGPVARYNLDYVWDGKVLDSSGNDNTGTVYGPVLTEGRFGQALDFDGVNDYVQVPDSAGLRLGSEQTVEAWINVDSYTATWTRLVGKGDASVADFRNYGLWLQSDGDLLFQIWDTASSSICNFYDNLGPASDANIAAGSGWHHVAGTYNGTTGKLYVDGNEVHSSDCSAIPPTSPDPVTIGGSENGAYLNGTIDEVAIYDRTLTPGEVRQLYACTKRTECTFGPENPVQLQDGETYSFRARALDNVGRLGAWSPENHTSLDTGKPELSVNIEMDGVVFVEGYDSDGYEGSRLRLSGSGGIISYQGSSTIKLNSSAVDGISGIRSHYIRYCVISEGVEDCRRHDCPQTFLPGEISYCELSIPYGENMVIKFKVVAEDYAGNRVGFPGIGENTNFYITDHPLANFFVHQMDMLIGDSALLKVYVRNMQDRFDNVTVSLSGYDFASFVDAGDGDLSFDKKTLWIGLNPYEEKEIFVKVFSSSIGQFFVYLNATSTLTTDGELCSGPDCVKDSDTASVSTGYPLEFPGINIWGILLIVMVSLIVYYRVGKAGRQIPI